MADFTTWERFSRFMGAVVGETRYIYDRETEDFLQMIRQTATRRVEILPPETPLWRAQQGNVWVHDKIGEFDCGCVPKPLGQDRMKPLRDCATEGRANPKGISFLYLATDRTTAIGEVRPWIGAYVSVGLFKPCRELTVVNCTATGDPIPSITYYWGQDSPAQECEETLWTRIGDAFARPVTLNDTIADYVPTQIIAELLKVQGFDGIKYRSSLGEGQNILLFDQDAADLVTCQLFQVSSITLNTTEVREDFDGPQ